jgi:dTDP-4-amino-4,6-dideoxygalactose transaminase
MTPQASDWPHEQGDIPFVDLVASHRELAEELNGAFRSIVRSASFVGGAEVEGFERDFAQYCGTDYAVGVSSGTDALRFAYIAAGLRPGDEVITVPNTFIATTEAITQAGGTIRFVDVRDDTLTIDAEALAAAVSPRTVGVVPVHLYGQPANLNAVMAVAKRHGLWVIEDAAQAHGAVYGGKRAAVVTRDPDRATQIRRLRDHGQNSKYFHDVEGYNGRLDAMQAAFLRIKLRRLESWNESRRQAVSWYREGLSGLAGLRLVAEEPGAVSCYHLFVIRVSERDRLRDYLASRGIQTGLHYPVPLHLQRAYARLGGREGQFPISERAAREILSLPMYPGLRPDQVRRVVDAVRAFLEQGR